MARKRVLCVLAAALLLLCFGCAGVSGMQRKDRNAASVQIAAEETKRAAWGALTDSGIDYAESAAEIINPDRGFYQALSHDFSRTSDAAAFSVNRFTRYLEEYGLLHLRFGLAEFSSNGALAVESAVENGVTVQNVTSRGTDSALSEEMLTSLAQTLQNLRVAGGVAVIRFSYNVEGVQETVRVENGKAVNRYVAAEPAAGMSLIETHIGQIGAVLSDYTDVITSVESGMFGPWGEQHSTPIADSQNDENYYRLVNKWLASIPKSRTVGVRRPLYLIHWANRNYQEDFTEQTLGARAAEFAALGEDARRVGCYNDGYLGSSSDLGTFSSSNRASVVTFLNSQAAHTMYGGEVVADSTTGSIGAYNSVDFISAEGFLTHTSYLNQAWNYDKVIRNWENTPYTGGDAVYAGSTGYTYVANHLGYRFVLRSSQLSENAAQGGVLALRGSVENVGFGNVINEKRAELVLKGGNTIYRADVTLDARTLLSGTTVTYTFTMRLPSAIPAGNYAVYLKLSEAAETLDNTVFRTIRFANADDAVWSAELGANYLGTLPVEHSDTPGNYPDFVQEEGGTDPEPAPPETAALGDWGQESDAGYSFSDTGVKTVSWEASTNQKSVTLEINGYSNEMTGFSIAFTADSDIRLGVYAGWNSIIGHREFVAGENRFELPDISETQGYRETMLGHTSFLLRFFFDYDRPVTSAKSVTFTEISLYAPEPAPPETFTVTFDLAGGTLTSGSAVQEVLPGENAVPPACEYPGHVFSRWDSAAYENVTEDVTVTAEWRTKTYRVTFNGNGGTLASGDKIQTVEHGAGASAPVFTREGFAFSGWDKTFDSVTADMTVTAQWTADLPEEPTEEPSERPSVPPSEAPEPSQEPTESEMPSAPAPVSAGCAGCGGTAAMLAGLAAVFLAVRKF